MSYILTFDPGTEDERSEVIRYLMEFDDILEEMEEWPDGSAVMIRRADYLDLPERTKGHLTLIKGGK